MTNEMNENMEEITPEKPSIFGMIMNPGIQFKRIKQNPKVLIALIVVTLLTIAGMLMMARGMDFASDPELMDMGEDELMMITLFTQLGMVFTGLFTPIVGIMISVLIYFVIAKITQSDVTFKQLFSLTTYIYFISSISIVVNGLAMMLVGSENPDMLFTSLNSIVGAEGALGGLLNSIEVFQIWTLIITALGLQIVAGFSKKLSWAVVIVWFLVGAGFTMISASMTTMLGV